MMSPFRFTLVETCFIGPTREAVYAATAVIIVFMISAKHND
jgi:hypothetical protein